MLVADELSPELGLLSSLQHLAAASGPSKVSTLGRFLSPLVELIPRCSLASFLGHFLPVWVELTFEDSSASSRRAAAWCLVPESVGFVLESSSSGHWDTVFY